MSELRTIKLHIQSIISKMTDTFSTPSFHFSRVDRVKGKWCSRDLKAEVAVLLGLCGAGDKLGHPIVLGASRTFLHLEVFEGQCGAEVKLRLNVCLHPYVMSLAHYLILFICYMRTLSYIL